MDKKELKELIIVFIAGGVCAIIMLNWLLGGVSLWNL